MLKLTRLESNLGITICHDLQLGENLEYLEIKIFIRMPLTTTKNSQMRFRCQGKCNCEYLESQQLK